MHHEPRRDMLSGVLAKLSFEAVKYAEALGLRNSVEVAERLYAYNRQPASPSLQRRFPTANALTSWLEGALTKGRKWTTRRTESQAWMLWESPGAESRRRVPTAFKLYVSPTLEALPDVLGTTLETLHPRRVVRIKAGRTLPGLLRPDKIVAYFWTKEELDEAAGRLAAKLSGCPPHGVPFTAEILGEGLLSWGMDPPPEQWDSTRGNRQSWRWWVAYRLAEALVTTKPSQACEPSAYALNLLREEGVNVDSWTPPTQWMTA